MGSRAGRLRPSADHEVRQTRTFDLHPIVGAHPAIRRAPPLRDYPFEPRLLRRREKGPPVRRDMIAVTYRPLTFDQPPEQLLAPLQRQRTQVEAVERHQVEHLVIYRRREAEARGLARVVEVHPAL